MQSLRKFERRCCIEISNSSSPPAPVWGVGKIFLCFRRMIRFSIHTNRFRTMSILKFGSNDASSFSSPFESSGWLSFLKMISFSENVLELFFSEDWFSKHEKESPFFERKVSNCKNSIYDCQSKPDWNNISSLQNIL